MRKNYDHRFVMWSRQRASVRTENSEFLGIYSTRGEVDCPSQQIKRGSNYGPNPPLLRSYSAGQSESSTLTARLSSQKLLKSGDLACGVTVGESLRGGLD